MNELCKMNIKKVLYRKKVIILGNKLHDENLLCFHVY